MDRKNFNLNRLAGEKFLNFHINYILNIDQNNLRERKLFQIELDKAAQTENYRN